MKLSLPAFLALFVLIPLTLPTTVFNQTPSLIEREGRVTAVSNTGQQTDLGEEEDDEQLDRVARLTFIEGDVSFLRAGTSEWADAAENIPLLAGDQIYTARGARAEIQLSRGNYIRLSEQTALTFTDFSDTTAQFEVTEGSILVRLERFGAAFNRFEVDTPNAAMLLKQDGFYRVNVRGEDFSEMIARDGSAEVTTDDGVFTVREGYRLVVDTGSNGRLDIARADSRDQWEQWSYDRDTTIDRVTVNLAPDYVRSYETNYNSFYGASDLYDYGTWTSYGSYGNCWVPRVSSGWAPYRYGQWIWLPRSGWTWWSREPWGWAPYHYGRWVFINGLGWAWSPGFYPGFNRYNHRYYRWRPALVSFFNCPTPRGQYVGWYPLRPGERWRRPDHRDRSRLQYPGDNNRWRRPQSNDNWRRPVAREGITTIPIDGFARPDRSRSRPDAPDRDVDRWVKEGARPGLPDISTGGWVTSPVARSADGQPRAKRGITPPREIINRPVVTRNRPSDSNDGDRPGRERRLITPRGGAVIAAPGARRSRTSDDDHGDGSSKKEDEDSSGKNNRPSIRPRRDDSGDSSSGRASDDDSTRRRSRNNDDSNGGNNSGGDDSNRRRSRDNDNDSGDSDKSKRSRDDSNSNNPKEREPRRYVPAPRQDNDAGNNNSDRNREKRSRDNEGSRNSEPRRIDSPRNNNDGGSRTRSNDQPKSSDRPKDSGRPDSGRHDSNSGGGRKKGNG